MADLVSRKRLGGALLGALLWAGASAGAEAWAAPDLEGVWKIATPTQSLTPVNGPIPFTDEGRKRYEQNQQMQSMHDYDDYDITLSRCSSPGVPRLMLSPERFRIWQRYGVYTFDFEWNRVIRQINASNLAPRPDPMGYNYVPTMTGDSKGHWEGDTLVAVTDNLSERTLLDDLVPHTVDLVVTEHIRLLGRNRLEDRITINDPAYFTRPWDAVITYQRQPDVLLGEDVCLDRLDAHQPAFPQQ